MNTPIRFCENLIVWLGMNQVSTTCWPAALLLGRNAITPNTEFSSIYIIVTGTYCNNFIHKLFPNELLLNTKRAAFSKDVHK
jgi:hypothetical protein